MKTFLFISSIISVFFSIIISSNAFYTYKLELKKIETIKKKTMTLELWEHYQVSPNDIILTHYALKTWLFSFDKSISYDGIYNKNWLPLSYNYCLTIKSSLFDPKWDFDNDGIPDSIDIFPYDYSNWDFSIRNSDILDFDNDGIPNRYDFDADWNGIPDIYQTLCIEKFKNWFDQQIYSDRYVNILETNKDLTIDLIDQIIQENIVNFKISNDFTDEKYYLILEDLFYKLLSQNDVFIEIDNKLILINRQNIIDNINF